MSENEKRKPDRHDWQEALYFGHVRCEGCDGVDLSDVDTVNEAIEKWNEHVREIHQ